MHHSKMSIPGRHASEVLLANLAHNILLVHLVNPPGQASVKPALMKENSGFVLEGLSADSAWKPPILVRLYQLISVSFRVCARVVRVQFFKVGVRTATDLTLDNATRFLQS